MLREFIQQHFSSNVQTIERSMYERLSVSSSMMFILPTGPAIWTGNQIYVTMLPLVSMASMMFHSHYETKFLTFDRLSAAGLMLLNFELLFRPTMELYEQLIIAFISVLALATYFRALRGEDYDLYHSQWHAYATLNTAALLLMSAS